MSLAANVQVSIECGKKESVAHADVDALSPTILHMLELQPDHHRVASDTCSDMEQLSVTSSIWKTSSCMLCEQDIDSLNHITQDETAQMEGGADREKIPVAGTG